MEKVWLACLSSGVYWSFRYTNNETAMQQCPILEKSDRAIYLLANNSTVHYTSGRWLKIDFFRQLTGIIYACVAHNEFFHDSCPIYSSIIYRIISTLILIGLYQMSIIYISIDTDLEQYISCVASWIGKLVHDRTSAFSKLLLGLPARQNRLYTGIDDKFGGDFSNGDILRLVNLILQFLTTIQMKVVFIALSCVGSGFINKQQRVYSLPK